MDFAELGLSENTIKAVNEAGISQPTTVQIDVIPSILAGKDVFAIAPAGCGKTCSYVLPLIDIISKRTASNILIITAGAKCSVAVSDRLAVFNKYHEISESTLTDSQEDIDSEANVVIASPNLLVELLNEERIDLSATDILVVDDINLIKKAHQLDNLEKVLAVLPADKQNIVFTNRRSKETQSILDKILQTPAEIKIDKNKEQEAVLNEESICESEQVETLTAEEKVDFMQKNAKETRKKSLKSETDSEAVSLMKKYHIFGRKTPAFLLTKVDLAQDE